MIEALHGRKLFCAMVCIALTWTTWHQTCANYGLQTEDSVNNSHRWVGPTLASPWAWQDLM